MLRRLCTICFRPDDDAGAGGAAPPERPEWLPEKFKSPEELARAYAESERAMGQSQAELEKERVQFREALDQFQQAQERQVQPVTPAYSPESDPILAAYDRAMLEGDSRAALAIQLQLTQQLQAQERTAMEKMLEEKLQPLVGQMGERQAAEREMLINQAEASVKAQAVQQGLDYDASRGEIIEVIQSLGGMPTQGTAETYSDFLAKAVRVVHADAVIAASQQQSQQRGEKLSLAQLQPGARGRVAQGTSQEADAWAEIKGAKSGSYGELMGGR